MKITIDANVCTGHGVCESIRPDIFEVSDDGMAHLLTDELNEQDRDDLLEAVDQCPTQALKLVD